MHEEGGMNNATPNQDDLKRREEILFAAARTLTDPVQRKEFLDGACANDPKLRRRVEDLLAA